MTKFNYISDNKNSITSNGLGTIHCMFNAAPYQTVSWSDSQTFFYKIKLILSDIELYKKKLSLDEKKEYKRLFKGLYNLNKTPDENVIKECIIVFINGVIAVGLKIVGKDIFTVFKSTRLNEIKAVCNEFGVKTDFDNGLALDLFSDSYLNEMPPKYLQVNIAEKFVRIYKEDETFEKKVADSLAKPVNEAVKKV